MMLKIIKGVRFSSFRKFGVVTASVLTLGTIAQAAPLELTMQHMEQPPSRVEAMQVVVDKFNEKFPEYRMKQNVVGWGEAFTRVPAQIEAGVSVDLQQAIPGFFVYVREMGAKGVKPATSVYEQVAKEVKFIDAYVDQYRADGEIWAIPAFGMLELLMYNKKHFEEAGIPHPPKTTEDVLAAAKKLTDPENDRYGFALPASDTLAGTQSIYTWMGAFGGKKIFDDSCKPIVNNSQNKRAYSFLKELASYSPPDIGSYAWAEVEGSLVSGRASMITFKNAFMNAWINDSGLGPNDLGAAPIPVPRDGSGERFSLAYSNAFMVMTDDPKKQEGLAKFMSFWLSPEIYGEWLGTSEPGLFLPVTDDSTTNEIMFSAPVLSQFKAQHQTSLDEAPYTGMYGFMQNNYCPQVGQFEGQNFTAKAMEKMVVEDISPDEAVGYLEELMLSVK